MTNKAANKKSSSFKPSSPVKKTTGKKKSAEKKGVQFLKPSSAIKSGNPGTNPSSFFDDVYEVVHLIPNGRVTSYGAIAAYLGTRLSARMVGWAMNAAGAANPPVPAHRVVNRNGMLSGKHHFATPTLMEELLKKEKVSVKDDKIIDFHKLFWDPVKELL